MREFHSKGQSKYHSPDEIIETFTSPSERLIAREIFKYVIELADTKYYLSDGIMFKREGRMYKFLSISTVKNRLLIHVPVRKRDEIFEFFRSRIKIYLPVDTRDKNQIDIQLKDIDLLESLLPIILIAYSERE